jgi:hypothetical protein
MDSTIATRGVLALPHHFDELLGNIEPPNNRRDAAVEIPSQVRGFLENTEEFPTRYPHSRLTGSYARHTAIHGIKDVDFVAFYDVAHGEEPEPEAVLERLFDALRGLPEALGHEGTTQILRRQRRSIHVQFDDEDFHLDIVPSWLRYDIDEPLWVPDREWKTWVESDPLGYGAALSKLNADNRKKVVPLIKLFKHWRTLQMQRRRPKSYWQEALVYQHLSKGWVTSDDKEYAELFTDLLRSIRDRFQPALNGGWVPEIPDPMLGHNVAFNWEWLSFKSFMTRLDESIGWAERALTKSSDELNDAVALWQKVFGEEYFTDSARSRRLQHAEWVGQGTTFVTSAGHVLDRSSATERAVESRSHRFYGDAS